MLSLALPVTADLAKSLLEAEGIPSLVQGPDFDVAELGRVAHDTARGTNVYVPPSALEQAQAILERAWGSDTDDAAD